MTVNHVRDDSGLDHGDGSEEVRSGGIQDIN